MADRGYIVLLTHLHRPSTTAPLQTIAASFSHYIATLIPSPTPLTAAIISSPLFFPISHTKLQILSTAFRHAVHLKYNGLSSSQDGLFERGLDVRLKEWLLGVLNGFEGGMSVVRLACAGGLLLGLKDLKAHIGLISGQGAVEDEVVVAFAEVMETYKPRQEGSGWEKEFQPATEQGEVDPLSLGLVLASDSFTMVPNSKIRALPLPVLSRYLTSTIVDAAFQYGTFMDSLSSINQNGHEIYISPSSPFALQLHGLTTCLLHTCMSGLSKFCGRVLSILLELKPIAGLATAGETLAALEKAAKQAERGWIDGGLVDIKAQEDIALESREVTTEMWVVLKTLFFTTIIITESVLSTTVFLPLLSSSFASTSTSTPVPTPPSLALTTLRTFWHFSFIITHFGGVTSLDLPEFRKVFFLALDVLASDPRLSEEFVMKELCANAEPAKSEGESKGQSLWSFQQTKKAFALASIEQLVPVVSENALPLIFSTCFPHLSDATHRETFEPAHSVVLGIFAAHAQKTREGKLNGPGHEEGRTGTGASFVQSLVPFYVGCLIENSISGRLSTPQLRLAFSALVRSASSNVLTAPDVNVGALVLPQYCIDTLLTAIHSTSVVSSSNERNQDRDQSHAHRLHLTLISTLSSLPLPLLPSTLDSIREIVLSLPVDSNERKELIEELFKELLERVGDREKEIVMRWWYDEREGLIGRKIVEGEEENRDGGAGILSRL